jgi:hypothetical protein
MAQELVNSLWCRPSRVRALLNILRRSATPLPEADAMKLMVDAADEGVAGNFRRELLRGCELLGVISRSDDCIAISPSITHLSPVEVRAWMARRVLSARSPSDNNYRFCRLYSWMLISFERLLDLKSTKTIEDEFNSAFKVAEGDERLNDVKINVALEWAVELGLGWWARESEWACGFQPIPAPLIEWTLPAVLQGDPVGAETFLDQLATFYPCFDRGELFRGVPLPLRNQLQGRLSPGLSRALRRLHELGIIVLQTGRDAPSDVPLTDFGDSSTTFRSFVGVAIPSVEAVA